MKNSIPFHYDEFIITESDNYSLMKKTIHGWILIITNLQVILKVILGKRGSPF